MYKNLTEFIECLEHEGELLRIEREVATHFEMAEITDRISKTAGGGKAILFERNETQFPVVMNMLGSEKRIAMALGIDDTKELTIRIDSLLKEATAPKNSLWDKMRAIPLLAQMAKWLPSTSRSKGECQDVVLRGEQAKLSLLPILKCWGYDGGEFITLPMVNTIDPDTGARNVGMYRMQVLDDHTTGMHWHIHKTGARHYEAYKRRGERMPISVAIGGDPAYTFSATAPMPDNLDEYLLAGFLRNKKVNLVKCITNDIYVPSDCDFVIEGYVDPAEEKVVEGPFGDHTGFYSLQDYYPRFHVTAITHRKDPIYPATIVGIPPQEDAYIAIATERIFLSPIRFVMQPEVRDMTMPSAGTAHNIAILSIEKRYSGQGQKVIQSMWGAGQMMFNKYLIITDHQADIRNEDHIAALLRNVDLKQAVVHSEGVYDILDHATATPGTGGKLALDLTSTSIDYAAGVGARPQLIGEPNGNIFTARMDLIERWSTLLLFASPTADIDLSESLADIGGVNFIAIFDSAAESMNPYELLWLASANTDPKRDVAQSKNQNATLIIDARSKQPGVEGNPKRFPNIVHSLPEAIELVDQRWAEYNIGELIESPSRRYAPLALSQKEDW